MTGASQLKLWHSSLTMERIIYFIDTYNVL